MYVLKIPSVVMLLLLVAHVWAGPAPENKNVHVMAPFARAVPKVMKNGAAYMILRNYDKSPLVLTGIKGDVAAHIELHQSLMANGMMKMQPVDKLVLPPETYVEFKPGGYHIMLMGLKRQLKEGDSFHLTLIFDDGSQRRIKVPVRGLGAMPMQMHERNHKHDHKHKHKHKHEHHKQQTQGG